MTPLRFQYACEGENKWKQACLNGEDYPICTSIDLSDRQENELPFDIKRECSLLQQSLNIEAIPLIRAGLFNCGSSRPQRLLIVVHHLAIGWSIMENFNRGPGEALLSIS